MFNDIQVNYWNFFLLIDKKNKSSFVYAAQNCTKRKLPIKWRVMQQYEMKSKYLVYFHRTLVLVWFCHNYKLVIFIDFTKCTAQGKIG